MHRNRFSHLLSRILALVLACAALVYSAFAADFAWQDTNKYRPPDFEATFPIDHEAGKRLEQFWRNIQRETSTPEQDLDVVRRGLRTCFVDTQTMVLRWFGNKYIWGQSPQNPAAIDLMYHAAGSTNASIAYTAIYFGLSTVRPMTEPILHALVDIAIESEDPNLLSRVAWGGAAQKDRLLHHLKPHLASADSIVQEHAQTIEKIFSGELKAFAWATEVAGQKAEAKYSDNLEEFRVTLNRGNSKERLDLLETILHERIALIMDESFIPAFAAAATDADSEVREKIAIIVGQHWVWHAQDQAPGAIDLMMQLSRDPARKVRYNANYYGLSTIRRHTEAQVERMIEMALHDGLSNADFRGRVTWGLEKNPKVVRTVLEKWMANHKSEPIKAVYAYGLHTGFLKEEPEIDPQLQNTLDENKPVATLIGFFPTGNWKPESLEDYVTTVLKEVPEAYRSPTRWNTDEMAVLIASPDEVEKIEKALPTTARIMIGGNRPLTAQNLVDLGRGVRLQEIK